MLIVRVFGDYCNTSLCGFRGLGSIVLPTAPCSSPLSMPRLSQLSLQVAPVATRQDLLLKYESFTKTILVKPWRGSFHELSKHFMFPGCHSVHL